MTRTFHRDGLTFSTLLDWNKGSAEEWIEPLMWSWAQLQAPNLRGRLGFHQVSWDGSPASAQRTGE